MEERKRGEGKQTDTPGGRERGRETAQIVRLAWE